MVKLICLALDTRAGSIEEYYTVVVSSLLLFPYQTYPRTYILVYFQNQHEFEFMENSNLFMCA